MNPVDKMSPSVYQCNECRNIVADSTYAISVKIKEDSVTFSNVTEFVLEGTKMLLSSFGDDSGCVFISLSCRCGNSLGRKYISTVPTLDVIRNQYCLFQEHLYRYDLGPQSENSTPNSTLDVPDGYLIKCALIKFNVMLHKLITYLNIKGIIENSNMAEFDISEGRNSPALPSEDDGISASEDSVNFEQTDSGVSSIQESSSGENSQQSRNQESSVPTSRRATVKKHKA